MSNLLAFVREPSPSFVNALSSHPQKDSIEFSRACDQHREYILALNRLGVEIMPLEPKGDYPDGVFVEDTAVVIEGEAYLCSLREKTRRGETVSILAKLKKCLSVEILKPPIFVDGGDVLQTENALFVGLSSRTNKEAVKFFRSRLDRKIIPVPVTQGLHLKTAVSYLGKNIIVVDSAKIDIAAFSSFEIIETDSREGYAANCLAVGDSVILPSGYPNLSKNLRDRGFEVFQVNMSEFEKADGGVSCLSLIIT